jgi:predicted alpha-1,6-mannanase (GH76 family)
MYIRQLKMISIFLTVSLAACTQVPLKENLVNTPTQTPLNAGTLKSQGIVEDRDSLTVNNLLTFYNAGTGAWTTPTGEAWQPALGIEAVINTYQRTRDQRLRDVIDRSFARYNGRRSDFFDDDAWYLNAWIRAYDVTGDTKFLNEAKALFARITTAWDGTCNGGVWWNVARTQKNAITNELFLLSAARLHRRAPNGTGSGSYYDWAFREWNWFKNSGLIVKRTNLATNRDRFVIDALDLGTCQRSSGAQAFTYNQGVILGALVELWRIDADRGHLQDAEDIADTFASDAAPELFSLRSPILAEAGNSARIADAHVFKGIFAQGLARLYDADRGNRPFYRVFLANNANAVFRTYPNGFVDFTWDNASFGNVGVNEATQASAALLIGSLALLDAGGETIFQEAENARLINLGAETIFSGFSGNGYVAGWRADGKWIDFNINVPIQRTYRVTFRYAAGAGNASRFIYANGSDRVNNQGFTGTGGWGNYATVSVNLDLNAGTNMISLIYNSSKGSSNWLNIDRIEVQ